MLKDDLDITLLFFGYGYSKSSNYKLAYSLRSVNGLEIDSLRATDVDMLYLSLFNKYIERVDMIGD